MKRAAQIQIFLGFHCENIILSKSVANRIVFAPSKLIKLTTSKNMTHFFCISGGKKGGGEMAEHSPALEQLLEVSKTLVLIRRRVGQRS